MSEGAVMRTLMLYASEHGAVLFRNQVGHYVIAQKDCKSCQRFGTHLKSGLCVGSSDLIGYTPVLVGEQHVGRTLALFTGIEAKREVGGVVSDEQRRFLIAVETAGGIQGVARGEQDLAAILSPWQHKG